MTDFGLSISKAASFCALYDVTSSTRAVGDSRVTSSPAKLPSSCDGTFCLACSFASQLCLPDAVSAPRTTVAPPTLTVDDLATPPAILSVGLAPSAGVQKKSSAELIDQKVRRVFLSSLSH